MKGKIGVISLGCSKNRVDTEQMLSVLKHAGYDFVQDIDSADLIIVNTCGFIDAAKRESIDAVFEAVSKNKKVLVTGCLSQRYKSELADELHEADGIIGTEQYGRIDKIVEDVLSGKRVVDFSPCDAVLEERIFTTPSHYAYVKIAEGCDNCCTYCAIPYIRGKQKSRTVENILKECSELAEKNVKEIILVAQDTSRYGFDIYGKNMLAELLNALARLDIPWIRILYCYPERVNDGLLEVMAGHSNIIKYLDMPFQHIDDEILKHMGRRCSEKSLIELVEKIRNRYPDFTLRTTFISGFPGESESAHNKLLEFVKRGYFDRVGAFAYSKEEGTPAALLKGHLSEAVKNKRQNDIMKAQRAVSELKNQKRLNTVSDVLIDSINDGESFIGRSQCEAPEVDGLIFVEGCDVSDIGRFVKVRITKAGDYDLWGVKVN